MTPRMPLYALVLAVVGALYAGPDAAAGTTVKVGETIVLTAEGATLHEVLVEIGAAVPLELRMRGRAVEDPVTLTIEAPDWPDLFSEFLGRESYVLSFDPATGKPERLVVLWDKVRLARGAVPVGVADDIEARIRLAAKDVLTAPDLAGQAIARLEEARQAFLAACGAVDPPASDASKAKAPDEVCEETRGTYLGAMHDLEAHDDARSVQALMSAFEIGDRDVRLTALETLRWLSETGRNSEVVGLATGAFDTAEDELVERAALEVVVRYGDQDAVLRLLEPIALGDGPNQDLAVREWIRIRDEQKARAQEQAKGADQGQN